MCLNPRQIINPKKRIRKSGGENYIINVPCGVCAECVESKRKEACMRTYYEWQDTIKSNGFVYFETLTYNNDEIPKLSDYCNKIERDSKDDMTCFDKKHIQSYLSKLRTYIKRNNNEVKGNIKYFITSEYGSTNDYVDNKGKVRKGTKRPHYHILFFIKLDIDPKSFVMLSNKIWGKGRTDYNTNKWKKHIFNRDNSTEIAKVAISKYVSKYISKDYYYMNNINDRIKKIEDNNLLNEEEINKLKKQVKLFKSWSTKFGISGITEDINKECIENFTIRIPDKDKVWDTMKLPMYYRRKMHYDCIKVGNKYKWIMKDEYIQKYVEREYNSAKLYEDKINDMINNLNEYIKENDVWEEKDERGKATKLTAQNAMEIRVDITKEINKLLDGRTIKEYAEYITQYKGRIYNEIVCDDMVTLKYSCVDNDNIDNANIYNNFTHNKYTKFFGKGFVVIGEDISDQIDNLIENGIEVNKYFIELYMIGKYRISDARAFKNIHAINENTEYRFRNFDKLELLLKRVTTNHSKRCQRIHDKLEEDKKRLKGI